MRADQKIRQYPCSLAALLAMRWPGSAGQEVRFSRQRLGPNLTSFQK
jgi:hypothetical protein